VSQRGIIAFNNAHCRRETWYCSHNGLDAILTPGFSVGSSPAAVAGYPSISVPVGLTEAGRPSAIWMYSGFLGEPTLLALAYDLEQEL
jgi:Asp-tRNA(Asn)/Glu-tRNA(Gln) amidotransferase A subunit family amidase